MYASDNKNLSKQNHKAIAQQQLIEPSQNKPQHETWRNKYFEMLLVHDNPEIVTIQPQH